jgi:hypothetical protein
MLPASPRALRRTAVLSAVTLAAGLLTTVATPTAAGSTSAAPPVAATAAAWKAQPVVNRSFSRGARGWAATGDHDRLVTSRHGHRDGGAVVLRTSRTSTAALNDERNVIASTAAGRAYRATAWVRTSTPDVPAQLRIREVSNGSEVRVTDRTVTLDDRRWHRLRIRHVAAAAGSTLDLNVVSWDLEPRQTLAVDDVSVAVRRGGGGSTPPGVSDDCLRGTGSNATCGVLWGVYTTQVSAAEGWATPFTRLEQQVDRPFDVVKRYHDFSNSGGNGQFPDQYERQLGASGERTLYFAWTSNQWSKGTITRWRPIADGRYDASVIIPAAKRIKAWGKPVFLDFDHEMDGRTRTANGSPADYVAAYRHIHRVFDRVGVDNVIWAWVPTGTMGNRDRIKAMYPGNRYVDWLGYDPYNFYRCNGSGWESPEQSLRPFYDWMSRHINGRKPVLLGEYGSVSDPRNPRRVRDWYAGVSTALATMPRIKAVMQWNSRTSGVCDFRVTRDQQALSGFRAAGKTSYVTKR